MSQKKKIARLLALAIPIVTITCGIAHGGKPPKLPPVRYWITCVQPPEGGTFESHAAMGMDNAGRVVGTVTVAEAQEHAFLYSPDLGSRAVDLDQCFDNINDGVPVGSHLVTARDINDRVHERGEYDQGRAEHCDNRFPGERGRDNGRSSFGNGGGRDGGQEVRT